VTAAGPPAERSRLRAVTVKGWFRLVFAIIVVLTVAAAVIIAAQLAHGRAVSHELIDSILPAQAQAYRLQGALVDQETGVRGYGISGDVRFLQPYTQGLAVQADSIASLRPEIAAQRPLRTDLSRIQQASSQWRRSFALPLIALARHGPVSGHDIGLLDQSKVSFDRLRALFAAQNLRLAATAAQDEATLTRIGDIQDVVLAAMLAAFLLVAAVLAVLLHIAVIQPLDQLRAASRQVAGGEFEHRINPGGPADLQAVAADVEAMRGELVAALNGARVAEQTAARQAVELDAYAAELQLSNADLEQFAYVASHDLQEPLRKVASFCQLLAQRYDGKLDDRGRQYLDFAVDGAKRMQVLINDLLAFSRVGRISEVRGRLPTGQTLDAAIAALGAAIEESGALIERPEQLPDVSGDPTLLALVWQNLLGNAIKFRTPGHVPVIRITVSERPDGMWFFAVADNGIGIPPEFAEKVFVIFQRLHNREAYPGTGIGLAICKRIVSHHGGEVSLDTAYHGGTRIWFTLPRIAEPEPDADYAEGISE
jgi:signal transduction histidine kinase